MTNSPSYFCLRLQLTIRDRRAQVEEKKGLGFIVWFYMFTDVNMVVNVKERSTFEKKGLKIPKFRCSVAKYKHLFNPSLAEFLV